MARTRTIIYAGTYERGYPRNQQLIRLFRRCGVSVIEIHEPFWERFSDKSVGFGGIRAALVLAMGLLISYLRLSVKLIRSLRCADAVTVGYIGQLDMLVIGSIARMSRTPVIFNPLVTLTDTAIEDRGLFPDRSAPAIALWLLDWAALRIASIIIIDTEENAEYLVERFGVNRSRILSLYVGADEGVFQHTWTGGSRVGELHVLFYGKMIPLHGIETILESIRILFVEGETGITFEIIGSGQQAHLVHQFMNDYNLAPITYRPWVAYLRLPQRIALADCVLGVFGDGAKSGRVIPNKVFQALSVGAPVITRDSPAVRRLLTCETSALLPVAGDSRALSEAIRRLKDPGLRQRLGDEGHAAFRRNAADEALQPNIHALLAKLRIPASGSADAGRVA